jgi:hypothetical protein
MESWIRKLKYYRTTAVPISNFGSGTGVIRNKVEINFG